MSQKATPIYTFAVYLECPLGPDAKHKHYACLCEIYQNQGGQPGLKVTDVRDATTGSQIIGLENLPPIEMVREAASLYEWANHNAEIFTEGKTATDNQDQYEDE